MGQENNSSNENIQDNSLPVLTKEDLIFILESLLKFSQEPKNALLRKEDGLYALDISEEFNDHVNNANVHAEKEKIDILKNFSLVDDILNYKGFPVIVQPSKANGNAIQIKSDGMFIPDLSDLLNNHIENNNCHVTTEEKTYWNNILNTVNTIIESLRIYNIEFVEELPSEESTINLNTIYAIKYELEDSDEDYYARYLYMNHKWIRLDITNRTYELFARKAYVDNIIREFEHANKDVLDKFTYDQERNRLYFDGYDILDYMQISDDPRNALFVGSDGKLFVKDLSSELESISKQASLSKTVLLEQNCDNSGIYYLEEDINNFNFIMIHYYLMPNQDDPNDFKKPYDAKMEMLDVDSLNELYNNHIDYIIEHDYGMSTYNSKIRFNEDTMQVTYYNHVCIYKIIGVR